VVLEALQEGRLRLPEMESLAVIHPEKTFGDSRFDFYVEDIRGRKGFLEVKGVTLEEEGIASFPDAPTERGVKHVHGLVQAKKQGYLAYVVFVIQMEGMGEFRPNDITHPAFGEALREAEKGGVRVLAYQCSVTADSLMLTSPVPVNLQKYFAKK
jgi:sugar fermentation stimulation protein A